jgi:hypothetical protein
MEGEWFSLYGMVYDNIFVAGRKSTLHPVYCKFICHPVDIVSEELMNPIMVVVWLFKQMFSSNSIKRNLSINSYFIIPTCDAKSASILTSMKYALVFEECSRFFKLHGTKHDVLDLYRIVSVIMIITIIILDHKFSWCVS